MELMYITGDHLLRKLTLAIPEAIVHHRALSAFTDGMRLDHGDIVDEWEKEVLLWEADNTQPCPYDLSEESESVCLIYRVSKH
jgi:hypothetical protein